MFDHVDRSRGGKGKKKKEEWLTFQAGNGGRPEKLS